MYSYMAFYFLLYSNTDSSLAVRKAVEFALTLRAYSVLYAGRTFTGTKGKKQDHFVKTNEHRTIHEIDNNSSDFYIFATFLLTESIVSTLEAN
jgi:hypothetical protein